MAETRGEWAHREIVEHAVDVEKRRHNVEVSDEGISVRSKRARFDVVAGFADGRLDGLDIDVSSAWSVVMRAALAAFYSHPWAWNEIGFGGPAYPRGYMRMGVGDHRGRDPHEGEEAFGPDPVEDVGS